MWIFAVHWKLECMHSHGHLSDASTVGVTLMKLSGTGLSGFVGVNGPASNSDAMGLSLGGLDFSGRYRIAKQ
jgi:hypothetical protein